MTTGGEPAIVEHSVQCASFCDHFNAYGPTEAAICSLIYKVSEADRNKKLLPIGKPLDNVRVYILDANQRLLPIGITGELYIGGNGVSRGYLNKEELTASKFLPNPYIAGERIYRTGDLCIMAA